MWAFALPVWAYVLVGFCPMGFCPMGFCPDTGLDKSDTLWAARYKLT